MMMEPIQLEDPGRRTFLRSLFMTAAAALVASPMSKALFAAAPSVESDAVTDAINGLVAFIVPGPDRYSIGQGVSTIEPGGIDAGITSILIENIDSSVPHVPHFSAVVAGLLDQLAMAVNPNAAGDFVSPFARLPFAQKVLVFQIMDGTESLQPLAGVLTAIVPFLVYSEAGVFDRSTRTLTAWPVGWAISNYDGVADGRDELRGYYGGRRHADTGQWKKESA